MTFKEAAKEILRAAETYANPATGGDHGPPEGFKGISAEAWNKCREVQVDRVAAVLKKLTDHPW